MIGKVRPIIGVLLFLTFAATACAPAQAPTPTPTKAPVQETKPAAAAPTKAPEPTQPPAPTPTVKPVTVKYGSPGGTLDEAGLYVALEKGYFKEQGVTPELTRVQNAADLIAPLSTGELDVAITSPALALLMAADRGLDLKIGAGVGQLRPGWDSAWFVLRKDLADSGQVKTAADLKGMKVAVAAPASTSGQGFQRLLDQGGLKPGDVEVVTLPGAEQPAAFQNKAVAAGVSTAVTVVTGVQQGLFVKWVPLSQVFGGKIQGTVMLYSPAFAKDQDRARRWMIAYLKGARDFIKAFTSKEGRQEVVDILIKNTAIKDPKLYDLIDVSYIDPNGGLDLASLDISFKWWVDNKLYIGKKTFNDITDLSHADYAAQKLGRQ